MKPVDLSTLSSAASIEPTIDPNAAKMAYFSRLVYNHDIDAIKHTVAPFDYQVFQFRSEYKNAYIFANNTEIIVAHEGSRAEDISAYGRNANHFHKPHPLGNSVHAGFYNEIQKPVKITNCGLERKPMLEAIHEQISKLNKSNPHAVIHFTGHSSGGAATILQAAHMIEHDPKAALHRIKSVVTFGQPRVGSPNFSKNLDDFFKKSGTSFTRYVINGDLIADLPPAYREHAYSHSGTLKILSPPISTQKPYASRNPIRNIIDYAESHHSIGVYYQSCLEALNFNEEQYMQQLIQSKANFLPQLTQEIKNCGVYFPDISIATEKEKIEHIVEMLDHKYSMKIPDDIAEDILDRKEELQKILISWASRTEVRSLEKAGFICNHIAKLTANISDEYDELENLGDFARDCSESFQRKLSKDASSSLKR